MCMHEKKRQNMQEKVTKYAEFNFYCISKFFNVS